MKKWMIVLFGLAFLRADAAEMSAQQVLDKALSALGGKEKLEQIQTRVAKGKLEVSGLSGSYELWAKSPDKLKVSLDLGVVKQEQGYDGTVGWIKRTSVVEQKGNDLQRMKRSAIFQPLLYYPASNTPVSFKGTETVNGTEAYILEFSPEGGSPEQFYFAAQTGLLIREVRQLPAREGDGTEEFIIDYADYREVDGVKVPYSITQTRPGQVLTVQFDSYSLNSPVSDDLFQNPSAQYAGEPYDVSIYCIPHHVYKENDGVWQPGATEAFYFYLVVKEKHSRPMDPVSASLQFFSGNTLLQSMELSRQALSSIRKGSLGSFAKQEEIFDLQHYFSFPVPSKVDRLAYTLKLQTPEGNAVEKQLEIPIEEYQQKTSLIFPIKGKFIVAGAHDFNEDHSAEWSQHYAYDILGLGSDYQLAKNDGKANEDFWTWGREVLAPADGTIVFARNDVPDNKQPGKIDSKVFMSLPNPMWAVGGNNVVIDHGNGEFSLLAHLQKGSVRVKEGDAVKIGDVIGLLGNSGNSDAPHLHYHLMACKTIFQCDGLPSRFDNVYDFFSGKKLEAPYIKRGLFLEAR